MRILSILAIVLMPVSAVADGIDTVSIYASGGKSVTTWHGQMGVAALNFEFAHTLTPRTEIAFVAAPMAVHQPRSWFGNQFGDGEETVRAISGSLLLRHYFSDGDGRAVFFVEGSSGPMWAERRVPAATSRFNFASQLGGGVILFAKRSTPLMLGYRFMHISNGGYSPRNPGMNVSSVVVGTTFRISNPTRR